MKKEMLIIFLVLFTGCIYETPDATKLAEQSYGSTDDLTKEPAESIARDLGQKNISADFPAKKTIKGIEHVYDGCNGCLDYAAASAIVMRDLDPSLSFPFIMSLSGALQLNERDKRIEEFFDRFGIFGFEAVYASKDSDLVEDTKDLISPMTYLKSLLHSDILPVVYIDRYEIFESQSDRYKVNFTQIHDSLFVNILGYDGNKDIFITDPSYEGMKSSYQDIDYSDFRAAWQKKGYLLFYLYPSGYGPDQKKAYEMIRKDLKTSHALLDSEDKDMMRLGYVSRNNLYEYMKDINLSLAIRIKNSSLIFKDMVISEENNIDKIINIEKKIIQALK